MPTPLPPDQIPLSLLEYHWYSFARSTEVLPAASIRVLLQRLEVLQPEVKKGSFVLQPAARLFLLTAVQATTDDVVLRERWRRAVNGLKVLHSQYAWGSKQKREKLTWLAREPALLSATQATAAAGVPVPDELLAVLVIDGSDESCDALLPRLERSAVDGALLERLARLERFADPKGRVWPMMELIRSRLDGERKVAPAFLLADQIGVARGKRFRVHLEVAAKAARGTPNLGAVVLVDVDSEQPAQTRLWVRVRRPELKWSGWSGAERRDELDLGPVELTQLPGWLAGAATKLGVKWDFDGATANYLRGPRLDALLKWLRGNA